MPSRAVSATEASEQLPLVERRVYLRYDCEIPTTCQPASVQEMKERRWDGAMCDLSKGGVRVRLTRRFEKGTPLALELPGDGTREPSVCFVKVVHVKRDADGAWMLGCEFLSELSDDEMQRLLTANSYILSAPRWEGEDETVETP